MVSFKVFKSLLHTLAVLDYLPKLKMVIGLFLMQIFWILFPQKCFFLNTLSNDQVLLFGECDLKI